MCIAGHYFYSVSFEPTLAPHGFNTDAIDFFPSGSLPELLLSPHLPSHAKDTLLLLDFVLLSRSSSPSLLSSYL